MDYPLHLLQNTEECEGCENKNKKMTTSQDFFVEGWSIEGHVTKVVEQIVMNVGLLILYKQSL